MSKLLLMVHHPFSEVVLSGFFGRIPDVEVMKLSCIDTNQLQQTLSQSNMILNQIDYIIVEANYGARASEKINAKVLAFFLENCPQAEIIAYSGTTQCLAEALKFNPRLWVMDKNNNYTQDCENICQLLGQTPQNQVVTSRIYTTTKLKELLMKGHARQRAATCPEVTLPPEIISRDRQNSAPAIIPAYNTANTNPQKKPATDDELDAISMPWVSQMKLS